MVEDKFAQELRDKINYGVSRLSPIADALYFLLTGAFLALGRKNEIKISLFKLADNLKIKNKNSPELKLILIS